jgi:hypothetical protein
MSKAQEEVRLAQMLSNMKRAHAARMDDSGVKLRKRQYEARGRSGENRLLGDKTASATVLMEVWVPSAATSLSESRVGWV